MLGRCSVNAETDLEPVLQTLRGKRRVKTLHFRDIMKNDVILVGDALPQVAIGLLPLPPNHTE